MLELCYLKNIIFVKVWNRWRAIKQGWTFRETVSHFKVPWIKSTYVVYSGEAPLLVCVLTTCYKQVKVNTPHLWFSLLTHSPWKWVLFIFQTASRISDPKKGGEKSPSGEHSSLMFWKERQRKAAVGASCILYCWEKNYKQPTGSHSY